MNESSFIEWSGMSVRGSNIRTLEKVGRKVGSKALDLLFPEKFEKKRKVSSRSQIQRMNVHSSNQGSGRARGGQLSDERRQRLLGAALALFAERGYHGTSVPDVAKAARVATGSVYNYFADKNDLVNQVYRAAKQQLKNALLTGLASPNLDDDDGAEAWFAELWKRMSAFALAEPDAFRFLEMQDHVEYLDAESRTLELSVLGPLFLAGKQLHDRSGGPPIDIAIALLWGAFVGVVKAGRLGYLRIDDKKLAEAGTAAWRLIAPDVTSKRRKKGT
jgi:AcrR family transcriptional regulator